MAVIVAEIMAMAALAATGWDDSENSNRARCHTARFALAAK
ncbi:hypothetical protein [Shewanella sp. ECSMB14102]|nr:hypothetical protein [Shewanella sp. ECSMB14102]